MTREQAHKEMPYLAKLTDFLTQNEKMLRKLHKKYQKDTGEKMPFLGFVDFVYHNAQDLVIDPANN